MKKSLCFLLMHLTGVKTLTFGKLLFFGCAIGEGLIELLRRSGGYIRSRVLDLLPVGSDRVEYK